MVELTFTDHPWSTFFLKALPGQKWYRNERLQSHTKATKRLQPWPELWQSQRAGESELWARSCQDTRTRKAKTPNRKEAHGGEPDFSSTLPLILVCSHCRHRTPQTGGLTQQKCILPQFWSFEVEDQGADRFGFWWRFFSFLALNEHLTDLTWPFHGVCCESELWCLIVSLTPVLSD